MSQKLSLKDCSVANKKVLIRVDFNVPLDKAGQIADDTRIAAALPSINYVLDNGGAAILMSHLGRPKNGVNKGLSLEPCAKRLSELLKKEVLFAPDCIGEQVQGMVRDLKPGQLLLLENLRFHKGEESPDEDPAFVKQLAALGDLYVNDAFGTAHRHHASTAAIAQYFPGNAAAGFLLGKEVEFLSAFLTAPARPFHAIIGGAKISSKIGVLKALLKKVDALLIGGAMAYTFFKAQGIAIGDSLCEEEHLSDALDIMQAAQANGVNLLLPIDNIIVSADSSIDLVNTISGIPDGYKGVDIGPKTVSEFLSCLGMAKTIFWNGPLGVFEDARFSRGTEIIAKALPTFSAKTIVGGGDSAAAVRAAGVAEKIAHLSTGGGASLEYIELGALPGIDALSNKNDEVD